MIKHATLFDDSDDRWLSFSQPVAQIVAWELGDVLPALARVETLVDENGWTAVGMLTYEAAAAFDAALQTHAPDGKLPLLAFSLFEGDSVIEEPERGGAYEVGIWEATVSAETYTQHIHTIKKHIADGDTYQVNYTFRRHAPFSGDPRTFFADLQAAQQGRYGAYLDCGDFAICSASPELFFTLNGDQITAKPMKGTAARSLTFAGDEAQARMLARSAKNRAENVMIVDMIRNDLGRVAKIGSVTVPELFQVTRYPTVWQMTATVTARTHAPLTDIFRHLFPCASITGAPKVRTMQIIRALETTPRGLYSGTIGFIRPGRQAQFNVAIRTAIIDKQRGQATYGVGGGIVWDSQPALEWAECTTKTAVLRTHRPAFSLLETLLWEPQTGCFLLERHLQRVAESAIYFGIDLEKGVVRRRLDELTDSLTQRAKVRLLVNQAGALSLTASEINPLPPQPRLTLAAQAIDRQNPFLYHKTTQRGTFEAARAAFPTYDDVLLWNERGELTETTIANVVFELDGALVTPPVRCGLLPGTLRAELLAQGRIHEKAVTKADLPHVTRLWLINSLRKWREASLI